MLTDLESLTSAFDIIDHVANNPILGSSVFVRVTPKGTLTLTETLWAQATVDFTTETGEQPAEFFIDRKVLRTFIKTAKTKNVTITANKDNIVLKAGQTLSVANQNSIPGYENWKTRKAEKFPANWAANIAMMAHYCPVVAGMEHLDAVCFIKGFGYTATDSLISVSVLDPTVHTDFYIPHSLAKTLPKGESKMSIEKDGVGIQFDNGSLFQPLAAPLQKYPRDRIKTVLQDIEKCKPKLTFSIGDLLEGLSVVAQFTDDKHKLAVMTTSEKTNTVNLESEIQIHKFRRSIPVVAKHQAVTSRWSVHDLLAWFQHVNKCQSDATLTFVSANGINAFLATLDGHKHILVFSDIPTKKTA